MKNRLSVAMNHKKTNRWVDFLEPLLREYNTSKIEGTSYTRQSVNKYNFEHFLSQLLKTDQPELRFNAGAVGPFRHEKWNRLVFRFSLGQKVLLSKRAEWKSKHRYHAFEKYSVEGGYSSNVYTVSGMQLRRTRQPNSLVAVYSLREYGPGMHFYEPELKSVNAEQLPVDQGDDKNK